MLDGRKERRIKSKAPSIKKYQWQASCTSFDAMPESMKNRIQKNKAEIAFNEKILKAMRSDY